MINTILGSLSTLFNQDNNPQVPKAITQPGQTPKIEQPDYLSTQQHISTIAPEAEQWGRKEWRQWRKQQGLSKQEMRNIRAQALVGTQAPHDVSRGDLKRIERNVKAQTPGMALYAVSGRDAGRKVNQVTDILGDIASRWDGKTPIQVKNVPIEIEEEVIEEEPLPGQAPAQPVSPITYNWGDTVNSYWQSQNEKVLKEVPEEQLRQFDTNKDNKLDPNELMSWQQSIGAGNDLKFGSGTIEAASAKYGTNFNASGFKSYINPVNPDKVTNPKKVDNGTPLKNQNKYAPFTKGTANGPATKFFNWIGNGISEMWNSL